MIKLFSTKMRLKVRIYQDKQAITNNWFSPQTNDIIQKMIPTSNISYESQSSPITRRRNHNQLAFGIAIALFQIGISIVYGFFATSPTSYINVSSIILTILLALMVIVGFGLYLSYLSKLFWTSIGYSLMIVAVTIQLYPLVNAFWSKISFFPNSLFQDSFSHRGFSLYLANFDSFQATGNTITGAIKCSLAIVIGFSGIIGRSGPLQILIFTIFGTITYELNRQLAAKLGLDNFGSFTIFGFGGFLSFGSGLIYLFREKQQKMINNNFDILQAPVSISIVGILFIFLLCPLLAFQGDNSTKKETFTSITSMISVIFSMSASLITNTAISLLINGRLVLRDVQNGLLAGIVAGGSASFYITNLSFALICGFSAGILYPLFYNIIQKPLYRYLGIFCTYAPGVFALQSIIGAGFTSIYSYRIKSGNTNSFVFSNLDISIGAPFAICFASVGIGFVTGIVVGLIAFCINSNEPSKKFDDKYFWINDNCINYPSGSSIIREPSHPRLNKRITSYHIELEGDFDDPKLWRDIS